MNRSAPGACHVEATEEARYPELPKTSHFGDESPAQPAGAAEIYERSSDPPKKEPQKHRERHDARASDGSLRSLWSNRTKKTGTAGIRTRDLGLMNPRALPTELQCLRGEKGSRSAREAQARWHCVSRTAYCVVGRTSDWLRNARYAVRHGLFLLPDRFSRLRSRFYGTHVPR